MPPTKFPPPMHQHRASGQARFCWKGRHYYCGPWNSPEARKRYAELIGALAKEPDFIPVKCGRASPLTIAELIERWDGYAAGAYEGSSELGHYKRVLGIILEGFATLAAAEFGRAELREVREMMIARGWCRNVISRQVGRIRTVWRWAEEADLLPEGRWGALQALRPLAETDRRARRSKPRQPAEWRALAAVCRRNKPTVRAILLTLWWTGARPSEIRELKVGEVNRTGEVWVARPTKHKNAWRDKPREIAIGPRCQRVMAPYLEGKHPDQYVFEHKDGKCYQVGTLQKAVLRAARKAGVTLTLYECRHAARLRASQEGGLEGARCVLGHSTVTTTLKYAAGHDFKAAAEVARKIG